MWETQIKCFVSEGANCLHFSFPTCPCLRFLLNTKLYNYHAYNICIFHARIAICAHHFIIIHEYVIFLDVILLYIVVPCPIMYFYIVCYGI